MAVLNWGCRLISVSRASFSLQRECCMDSSSKEFCFAGVQLEEGSYLYNEAATCLIRNF